MSYIAGNLVGKCNNYDFVQYPQIINCLDITAACKIVLNRVGSFLPLYMYVGYFHGMPTSVLDSTVTKIVRQ